MLSPWAVAVDPRNGDLLVADYMYPRIRRIFANNGTIVTVAGNGTLGSGFGRNWTSSMGGPATASAIGAPMGVTVDPTGNIYIAADQGSGVYRVDAQTGMITNVFLLGLTSYTGGERGHSFGCVWG